MQRPFVCKPSPFCPLLGPPIRRAPHRSMVHIQVRASIRAVKRSRGKADNPVQPVMLLPVVSQLPPCFADFLKSRLPEFRISPPFPVCARRSSIGMVELAEPEIAGADFGERCVRRNPQRDVGRGRLPWMSHVAKVQSLSADYRALFITEAPLRKAAAAVLLKQAGVAVMQSRRGRAQPCACSRSGCLCRCWLPRSAGRLGGGRWQRQRRACRHCLPWPTDMQGEADAQGIP